MKTNLKTALALLMVFCLVFLVGCDNANSWQTDETYHWKVVGDEVVDKAEHTFSDWNVVAEATNVSEGLRTATCTVCGYKKREIISPDVQATGTVDLYAINDFHGEVDRMSTIAGKLKELSVEHENSLLINSGDMFQGAMESNSNYGTLLAECMDAVGFASFTIGNHEFDWGLEKLQYLSQNSETPFLGANIYHWNSSTNTWGEFASEIAQEYVVKTLPNGLKIGIIGIIGRDQLTSICSTYVQDISFKDPADVVPQLSEKLRNEEDCDVIVVSAHCEQADLLENTDLHITDYADAVFCAHTHEAESTIVDGVPFIQGKCNGQYISHIQLSVDENGEVTYKKIENIAYSLSWPNLVEIDELIDNSNESIADEANEVLATIDGYLDKKTGVARLVCHAIATYAEENYNDMDVVLAMVNQGRDELSGEVTYSDLYKAIPFDNAVLIARVSGADIYNETRYNQIWRLSEEPIENSNTVYYNIAVIDYLLYHQNVNKTYDYFRSAFGANSQITTMEKSDYDNYNYRLITRDFLRANVITDWSVYYEDNYHTNADYLGEAVDF